MFFFIYFIHLFDLSLSEFLSKYQLLVDVHIQVISQYIVDNFSISVSRNKKKTLIKKTKSS